MPPFGRHRILERAEIERWWNSCMRFPEALRGSFGGGVRRGTAFARRSDPHGDRGAPRAQLPEVPAANYPLGSAAFDEELRARVEAEAAAARRCSRPASRSGTRKFKNGRSLASCFPNGGRRVAAHLSAVRPALEARHHPRDGGEPVPQDPQRALLRPADPQPWAASPRTCARSPTAEDRGARARGAEERFEQGKRLYFTRMGQRNFACASCHLQGAGKRYVERRFLPRSGRRRTGR
jgi:sulfur-oxidizing protein SoxA